MTFLGQKLQKRISSPTTEVQIFIVQVFYIQIRVVQGLAILQKKYQIKSAVVFFHPKYKMPIGNTFLIIISLGLGQSESTTSLKIFNFFTSDLVPINKSYTYIYNIKFDVNSDRPVKKHWKKKSLETDPIALYYCPWVQRWSRKI